MSGINRVWGKIPNVIEQRLLVALYEAKQPMTQSEILDIASRLFLLNHSMNLASLRDKGLVAEDRTGKYTLTPAGRALTAVCLDYDLFATPQQLRDLTKQPASMTLREELAGELSRESNHGPISDAPKPEKATPTPKPTQPSRPADVPLRAAPTTIPVPLVTQPQPVVEQPKPKPVIASTPKPVAKASPVRRAPPPPPKRYSK